MKRFLLLTLSIVAFYSLQGYSQSDYDYEWAHHNIAFTLAEDFKAVTNTADEFTARGDGMEFGIFPFSDATVDHSNITAYTIAIAKHIQLEELDDVDVVNLNGLNGAYVEGYKSGSRLIVLGFIDPDTDTNFFATISFNDNDAVAEEEAIRIITSLRKKKS